MRTLSSWIGSLAFFALACRPQAEPVARFGPFTLPDWIHLPPLLAPPPPVRPVAPRAVPHLPATGAAPLGDKNNFYCDVVVVDSSLGGTMAALQAAAQGARVCLTSMTNWIGGQMSTQGVCAIDALHGLDRLPDGPWMVTQALQCLKPVLDRIPDKAHCWVSRDCCSPAKADRAFKQLAAPYLKSGRLRVFYETVPKRVQRDAHGLRGVESVEFVQRRYTGHGERPYAVPLSRELDDWYDAGDSTRYRKTTLTLRGAVFIDGTETGELLALAGAEWRQGREDGDCRSLAPEEVMGFVDPIALAVDSASEARRAEFDAKLFRFCPEFAAPAARAAYNDKHFYVNWERYKFYDDPADRRLSFVGYRRLQNAPQVTLINFNQSQEPYALRLTDLRGGNDYSEGNLLAPPPSKEQLADWRGGLRLEQLHRAECHSLAFAAWLADQPEAQKGGRQALPVFDLRAPANLLGTGTGLSKFPYLRDTRHLVGYRGFCMKPAQYLTTLSRLAGDPEARLAWKHLHDSPYYAGSQHAIGIAEYSVDLRRTPDGTYPTTGLSDLRFTEIPLEAAVSNTVPNLLAAGKNIAVHQIVGAAARTQPFECNVGKGVGAAAAVAAARGLDLHQVIESPAAVGEIQRQLLANGGLISWRARRPLAPQPATDSPHAEPPLETTDVAE